MTTYTSLRGDESIHLDCMNATTNRDLLAFIPSSKRFHADAQ
ncbi:MAG: hypothetical protein ACTSRT_19385 [Promethearchaeota archaeon]